MRFMPTSITIAPGLTQSPPDQLGARRRRRSARRRGGRPRRGRACASGRSVTVALAAEQQLGHRLAEEVRAPDDDGLGALELARRPRRAAASRPSGVHGRRPGAPEREQPGADAASARRRPCAGRSRPVSSTPSRWSGHRQLAEDPADVGVGVERARSAPTTSSRGASAGRRWSKPRDARPRRRPSACRRRRPRWPGRRRRGRRQARAARPCSPTNAADVARDLPRARAPRPPCRRSPAPPSRPQATRRAW